MQPRTARPVARPAEQPTRSMAVSPQERHRSSTP